MRGRGQKEKCSQKQRGWQRLHKTQQSNAILQARQGLTKKKQNIMRRKIALLQNGYNTLIIKEKKMKRTVKLHQSVNNHKQMRQRRKTTRYVAKMIKIRASL